MTTEDATTWGRLATRVALVVWGILAFGIALANKLIEVGWRNGLPERDSGVFATVAVGILDGLVPYRDLWDHKPPGVYYIDALLLALLGPTPWSLHVGEAGFALLSLVAFYALTRSYLSAAQAAFGTAVFSLLTTLPIVNGGGNFTETYYLLPACACYAATLWFARCPASHPQRRAGLLLLAGAAAAGGLLLKQQGLLLLAGVELAVLVDWVPARRAGHRASWMQLGKLAGLPVLGATVVLGPIVAYFVWMDAGGALWQQVVSYNQDYIGAITFASSLRNLANAVQTSVALPFLWCNTLVAVVIASRCRLGMPAGHLGRVWLLLMAWFGLATVGVAIGGRFYSHYFLLLAPASLGLLLASARLSLAGKTWATRRFRPWALLMAALMLEFLWGTALWTQGVASVVPSTLARLHIVPARDSLVEAREQYLLGHTSGYPVVRLGSWDLVMEGTERGAHEEVAAAILAATGPEDRIFVWGADAALYFLTGRRPVSRYVYAYPLVGRFGDIQVPEAADLAGQAEVLTALDARRPKLVIISPPDAGENLVLPPAFTVAIERCYEPLGSVRNYQMYLLSERAGCEPDAH